MRLRLDRLQRGRLSPRKVLIASVAALALAAPASSAAEAGFKPCGAVRGFDCAYVPVPLDRSGVVPGTVNLFVERGAGDAARAPLFALAGGPGEGSTAGTRDWERTFARVLGGRRLVIFDQRGTGSSGALRCRSLDDPSDRETLVSVIGACAAELGAARGFYRTSDSVDDIEALREAVGAERIVLAGVSYGTTVALAYASRYPDRVERLVLDSVVPLDQDAFHRETYAALAPVLSDICDRRCGFDPHADLTAVAARASQSPLQGSVVLDTGRRLPVSLDQLDLHALLPAGDFDPVFRAELPAALHAARSGDPAQLLRLGLWGLGGGIVPPGAEAQFSIATNVATLCEETPLPWARESLPDTHLAAAQAALDAIGTSPFAPFDAHTALDSPPISECLGWPQSLTPPVAALAAALPDVPVLVLSGADDLRTPYANARRVADLFPHASLVRVRTGHSVLGSDLTGCADRALSAFFANSSVPDCSRSRQVITPARVAPTTLARLAPLRGARGLRGRTAAAALATLEDLRRSALETSLAAGSVLAEIAVGGLRSGRATGRLARTMRLDRMEYVPGVTVSGSVSLRRGTAKLHVAGRAAARGTLTIAHGKLHGRLAGRPVRARITVSGAAAQLAHPRQERATPSDHQAALRRMSRLPRSAPARVRSLRPRAVRLGSRRRVADRSGGGPSAH